MQVVIEIPNKVYSYICREWKDINSDDFDSPINHICIGIKNGIVLPKGHSKLIDRKQLYMELFQRNDGTICPNKDIENFDIQIPVRYVKEKIMNAPTIIEADKGV